MVTTKEAGAPPPGRWDVAPHQGSRTRAWGQASSDGNIDAALAEALCAWRLAESRGRKVPAYCVLPNRTLEEIARVRPADAQALLAVKGLGPRLIEQYGAAILALVRGGATGEVPSGEGEG